MAVVQDAVSRVRNSFFGWRVLALMMASRAGGGGVSNFSTSLFIIPMEQTFGISRGLASTIFAAGHLTRGISSPFTGALVDRFGARVVLLIALLLCAGGYILFAQAQTVVMVFIIYLGVISLGSQVVSFQASSVIINNWFDKHKGMAMSLLQVGAAVGGLLIVPLLAYIIATDGWQTAATAAGVIMLVLVLPAVIFSRNTPEEMGYQPDGVGGRADPADRGQRPPPTGLTLREAIRTPVFWLILVGMITYTIAAGTMQLQFVPIMVSQGLSEVNAAFLLSVWAFMSIPVVLGTGWLGDRTRRLYVAAGVVASLGLGVVLVNMGGPLWVFWVAVLLMSGNHGFYPLIWATVGEAFGRRAFGSIRGTISGMQTGVTMGAPILAGYIFDWTGAYTLALWLLVGSAVASAFVLAVTASPRFLNVARRAETPTPA